MQQLRYTLFALPILVLSTFQATALEPITEPDAPIIVYKVESGFDETKDFLQLAITDKGMKISTTMHISEMLDRTAKDTGLEKRLYEKAESLEFCSVIMSYKMSEAHPANLAVCPLTISLYTLPDAPEHTYITYQRPYLLGDGAEAADALVELLDSIVRSAVE